MNDSAAIEIKSLTHSYGTHRAVDDVTLTIRAGEIFAFLGPNGSGKTTLFRVLSTLIPIQQGDVEVLGHHLRSDTTAVRQALGIVFQAPSLDKKLTVAENLIHQGRLYGLSSAEIKSRSEETLTAVGMLSHTKELVETLSGGMRRRVELAKGLIHSPRVLLLDEPSTGLDPGARADLWKYLDLLRTEHGATIILTTHLLEEAEHADRLAIMHQGKIAAVDTPEHLRSSLGGDSITIATTNPQELADQIRKQLQCEATVLGGKVRLEQANGHQWIARLVETFPKEIQSVTLGKPTLEDVFIDRTGHRFFDEPIQDGVNEAKPAKRSKRKQARHS